MAMLVSLTSIAAEVTGTLTFDDKAKRTVYTTSQQVWTENGITVVNDKSASTSNVADYAKPARFYASSKITVKCDGTIKQIVFDCNSGSYATALKNSISGSTVTVSSDKVTVVPTTEASEFVVAKLTAQVRVDAVTVTYVAEEEDPDAPVYTITATSADETMGTVAGAGDYKEGKTVTLTANANPGYEFVKWSNESTDNPLVFEATENVTLTASFQAQTPITIAEANKLADSKTCILKEFTVAYIYKSYIHIQDASGYAMIYASDFGLNVGDVVSGFTCSKSTFNGLPQFVPSCKLADLTVVSGEAPAIAELTTAPTGNHHQVVKLMNLQMTGSFTTSNYSTIQATCPDGTKVAIYNAKNNLAYTFVADKAYNITGDVCLYSGNIQVSVYAIEEYIAPAPCTSATPVLWSDPVFLDANADQWYLVDIADAVAAEKNLTLTIYNTSEEDVEITIDSYSTCPADELDRILSSTKTIKAGETLEKDVNFVKYLQGLVDKVYLNVITKGGAIKVQAGTATYNVNVTAENGTVEGAGTYEHGDEVTLTATPAEGYEFVNWTAGETVVSTENPYTFTVAEDVNLVANFKEKEVAPAKLYLTPNANWLKDNARFAAYFFGNGETWVSMTKVAGETKLYEVTTPTDKKYPNVIFCRMNPSATANNWNNKWNQTDDLVIPTDGKNHYTVKENTWDKGGGTWSIWPVPTVKNYVDITITVIANAPASIKWYDGGDKLADATDYVAMTAGENNAYTYTLAQVDELTGVNYIIQVGDFVSTPQNTSKDVTVNFKDILPQVAVQGINNWDGTDKMTVADDYLTASITLPLEAKTYELKVTVDGAWFGTTSNKITRENNSSVFSGDNGNGSITADVAGDYVFTYTYATKTLTVTYPELEPEIEWIPMDLEISNLTTEEMEVEGAKYLQLMGRDDMNDADVMLFLNNYTGEEKEYEVNAESSYMTFGGMELTVLEGAIVKKGDAFSGVVRASVEEEGETMYVEFSLYMYAAPATVIELTDAIVAINEDLGTLTFNVPNPTTEGEGYYVELAGYTGPGVHEGPQICLFMTPEAVAYTNYAETSVADGIITLKGYFVSPMGPKFDVTVSGKLPVVEPEVVEPTYTENNLNTYAFGLESVLTDEALVVTYRLNNSNADAVEVVVLNGEKVVATVPGTTTIGKNTVEIPVAELPQGFQLTWKVVVKGTSVEAPTQEAKIYSFYHPSGLDIDNNPENPTFGMLLINEGMHSVKSMTEGYVSAGFGAGIFAFTPSLDLIPNGELPGYNGGIEFTNNRPDKAATAYAPRRIRISEDGRIFVTSLNTDGNYLWEVNPANMNEWNPVFKGILNDQRELITEDSAFIAAPNTGFDVKGAGENLQLAMYSVNLSGINSAAMGGFRLHEYNLGTATDWATAPSKAIVEGKYAINYTGTQVEYDNEGGLWIASYRGSATEGNPGLVHINANGAEDLKLVWNNVRQAGIRFNKDFTKLVVAGYNGAAKKATVYTISKDANGAPVLTEEAVIDMAVVGNNLNDFAWDYAGNLYACGNSSEKLVGWAMPYSGEVATPAAAKYAFHIGELLEKTEMTGVVKRAINMGKSTVVLTHEQDGTANLYNVIDGDAYKVSQEGVIARDPENAGDYLAISDIAVTEDGKLVATNYMQTQSGDDYVDAGYKRGETRIYIWNDLTSDPSILFTSKMSSNWFRSKQGLTMAVKGTSDNMEIFMTGIHATKAWARASSYRVIDGVYVEPEVNHNDHYFFYDINDAIALETTVGTQYELNASPLGEMNWVLDAELINPTEIVESATNNVEIATSVALIEDLGKKYNGATYVTVDNAALMVAPFANPDGELVGVEILNITNGFDVPQYVDMLYVDEAVAAEAAATAVEVVEGGLNITLVADATIHTWFLELNKEPEYQVYEDEITNLVIDLDNLVLIGGPSSAFQVDVFLGLGEYNRNDDTYQLLPESSIAVMGQDATFIDGYAYEVDAFTPSAKAVVHCEWNGMLIEFHLTMSAEPMEATKVVVENAVVEIEKYVIFGDVYDYSLKMSGEWINPEDGLTYPVLVEVPVYYPEATEPSEIMSTVTVGGWEDDDPWLGFGEGTLTVTTVGDVITATGIVQNPMAGVAIDITISGSTNNPGLGLEENATVTVKSVKMIQNGQLIIKKGDVLYNANGAVVK